MVINIEKELDLGDQRRAKQCPIETGGISALDDLRCTQNALSPAPRIECPLVLIANVSACTLVPGLVKKASHCQPRQLRLVLFDCCLEIPVAAACVPGEPSDRLPDDFIGESIILGNETGKREVCPEVNGIELPRGGLEVAHGSSVALAYRQRSQRSAKR